ncbi:reticulon-1-A-like isoform X2 [Clarias magur]|uniref:Reticulon-1-A-like isoform X2 n=1 Tax=Clarias magur TaxID=1594786 RepID=A0A8J4U7T1_CLAMG|nr:reticulon-1-A-like isoform X2 [Clarias magur]
MADISFCPLQLKLADWREKRSGDFSVVSVMAYLALAALSTTISFRVYKSVLQAVQKTDDGHPFK